MIVRKIFKFVLIHALCFGLALNPAFMPLAHASQGDDDYNSACGGDMNKKTDTVKSQCAQALIAKNTRNENRITLGITAAALVAVGVLAIVEKTGYGSAAAANACQIISLAVPAVDMAADIVTGIQNGNAASAAASSMTTLATSAMSLQNFQMFSQTGCTTIVKTGGTNPGEDLYDGEGKDVSIKPTETKTLTDKGAAQKKQEVKACTGAVISLGIATGMRGLSLSVAAAAFNDAAKIASTLAKDPGNQVQVGPGTYSLAGSNSGSNGSTSGSTSGGGSGPATPTDVTDACANATAGSYLSCVAVHSPDIQKMTADPGLGKAISSLTGKSMDDFARNIPSEPGAVAGYVASSMGLDAAGATSLADTADQFQKAITAATGSANYTPSSYASKAAATRKKDVSDDVDFNKLMADMMKNLNKDKDKKEGEKAPDKNEQAMRVMELLPADKIAQSRDISIFLRVGFRYRKSLDKVDSLNWAVPQNAAGAPQVSASNSGGALNGANISNGNMNSMNSAASRNPAQTQTR